MRSDQTIATWEKDGGAFGRMKPPLVGTENQIAWAEQIRANAEAEFDRVAAALESIVTRQAKLDQSQTRLAIAILEEKHGAVMDHSDAGYFIEDWHELRDQVRRLVKDDSRYKTAGSNKVTATESTDH